MIPNQDFPQGLSIVIPIFNECDNIFKLFNKLEEFSAIADFPFHFILVDGCSSDGTPELIEQEINRLAMKNIDLVRMDSRCGYGFDILQGLQMAEFDTAAWTHADLQTDLNDLITGYKLISESSFPCVVKGRRINRAFLERFFTFGMQIFTYFHLKVYLDDINAQPKIFKRSFYQSFLCDRAPNDFSLDLFTLMQARANDISIKSFDVFFNPRVAGVAKGGGGSWRNRVALIKRTIKYILATKK